MKSFEVVGNRFGGPLRSFLLVVPFTPALKRNLDVTLRLDPIEQPIVHLLEVFLMLFVPYQIMLL